MKKSFVRAVLMLGAALALLPALSTAGQAPAAPAAGAPGLRYEIWVELDAAGKMLTGKEEIVWTNPTKDAVPDMLLHLYWNAFKNEASAFMREAAAETMFGGGAAPEDGEWGWVDVTDIRLADGTDLKPALPVRHPGRPGPSRRPDGGPGPVPRPRPAGGERPPADRVPEQGPPDRGPLGLLQELLLHRPMVPQARRLRGGPRAGTATPIIRTRSSSPTSPISPSTSPCRADTSSGLPARPSTRGPTSRPARPRPLSARPWSTTSPG